MKCSILPSLALLYLFSVFSTGAGMDQTALGLVKSHSDMHVVVLGDSNSSIGGDECDQPQGWTKWFCELFRPASMHNYARSGATWTNTTLTRHNETENTPLLGNNNVIYNQVRRLFTAYDNGIQPEPHLIIIAAGTNDVWFTKSRPHVFDDTPERAFQIKDITQLLPSKVLSLAAAVRYNTELLRSRFPQARIILLTPMQCTAASNQQTHRAGELIAECAGLLGVDVIRQDTICCIDRDKELQQHIYTIDGIHTNPAGAEQNGRILYDAITKILQH